MICTPPSWLLEVYTSRPRTCEERAKVWMKKFCSQVAKLQHWELLNKNLLWDCMKFVRYITLNIWRYSRYPQELWMFALQSSFESPKWTPKHLCFCQILFKIKSQSFDLVYIFCLHTFTVIYLSSVVSLWTDMPLCELANTGLHTSLWLWNHRFHINPCP